MRGQDNRSGRTRGTAGLQGLRRRRRCGLVLVTLLAASSQGAAFGDQIWVDQNNVSCDDEGSGSQQTPFCTISAAIDYSNSGDEVIVRPGSYGEQVSLTTEAITVRSEQGAEVTTISGAWTTQTIPVVDFGYCVTASSVLDRSSGSRRHVSPVGG